MASFETAHRFARIMFVGSGIASADTLNCHLVRVLRDNRHAVCCYDPADPLTENVPALSSLYNTFNPSLILWDVSTGAVDESLRSVMVVWSCCTVAIFNGDRIAVEALDSDLDLFDFVVVPDGCQALLPPTVPRDKILVISPVPDRRYQDSVISDPDNKRQGIACTQQHDTSRQEQMEAAMAQGVRSDSSDSGYVATSFSWPRNIYELHPNGCASFYLRTARYCVFFKDEQQTRLHEIALRDAEGLLVLVEQDQNISMPEDFDDIIMRFPPGHLSEVVKRFEDDPALLRMSLEDQHREISSLKPLEESMDDVLCSLEHHVDKDTVSSIFPCSSPENRIVLFGWFGAHNFGDDLLLNVVSDRIKQRYDNAHILVIGGFPKVIYEEYGYEAAAPHEKSKLLDFLKGSAALVYCGGLVFDDSMAFTAGDLEFLYDPWIEPAGQASIALLARVNDVMPVFLGIGAGPVAYEATQQAIHLMGLAGSVFIPRDQRSCNFFLESGVDESQVHLKTDLIFGARDYVDAHAGTLPEKLIGLDYFVVSLRTWHLNPDHFAEHIAQALDQVVANTDLTPVFLPFDSDDTVIHQEVCAHMTCATRVVLFDRRPDEPTMLAILKGSRLAFAMRLHCSIIHHVLGKPAVGLNYNDKIESHFDQIGRREFLFNLDDSPTAMAQRLTDAAVQGCIDADARKAVERNDILANEAFDELFTIVDAWEPQARAQHDVNFPRTVSKVTQERDIANGMLHAAESALQEARDDQKRLSDELDDVYSSRSWKLARRAAHIVGRQQE